MAPALPDPPVPTEGSFQASKTPDPTAAESAFVQWLDTVTSRNAAGEPGYVAPPPTAHHKFTKGGSGNSPPAHHRFRKPPKPKVPKPRHTGGGGSGRHTGGGGTGRAHTPRSTQVRYSSYNEYVPAPGNKLTGGPAGGPPLTENTGGTYVYWEAVPTPIMSNGTTGSIA